MKKAFFLFFIFSVLLMPLHNAAAQEKGQNIVFDTSDFPQWGKDLRRWNIITFGVFPFSMFFVTLATDMVRWNNFNGMNFSDLSYAPWPLKSAGAVEMTNDEYSRTILLALGVSALVAVVDFVIVKIKRDRERRQHDARPAGTYTLEKSQISSPAEDEEIDVSEDKGNGE